jgi:hypothetical protein
MYKYDTYVQIRFQHKFQDARVPCRKTMHRTVNKLIPTVSLLDINTELKYQMFTEEQFKEISARLENLPQKSLGHIAQETRGSKSSAQTATKIVKLKSLQITVVHEL